MHTSNKISLCVEGERKANTESKEKMTQSLPSKAGRERELCKLKPSRVRMGKAW